MAVEPPLRVESREELVWLLAQACELEHGLTSRSTRARISAATLGRPRRCG
jgi:hypothetical protein